MASAILARFHQFGLFIVLLILTGCGSTPAPTPTPGFASIQTETVYTFDLLRAPALAETVEIAPDQTMTISVATAEYLRSRSLTEVTFDLVLDMQRANLVIRDERTGQEETVTDFRSKTHASAFTAGSQPVRITIKNTGRRSAIFTVSVRPQ
ncbi:MAG: hypothetical protein MUE40_17055 [Anaerolineae bacterium]|jgi:hypothetical protein|nr:hypothetical protein [Anaerolineae bacterium]